MSTSTIAPQITAFAAAVRTALADLTDEERDELTDALEADLAEAYAEDLTNTLPDPVEYATELRQAAGLPVREEKRESLWAAIDQGLKRSRKDIALAVKRNPVAAAVWEFGDSIRPMWWIVRAWVAVWGLSAFFGSEAGFLPTSGFWWAVLAVAVTISVQWGRGRWAFSGLPAILIVGNVIAAVMVLPAVAIANDWQRQVEYAYYDNGPGDLTGVYLNGEQVTNIFPYDREGKLIKDVRLFDQDGTPLATAVQGADGCMDPDCNEVGIWVPSVNENGVTAYNGYPMRMAPEGQKPQDRAAPFETVSPLVGKVAKDNQ